MKKLLLMIAVLTAAAMIGISGAQKPGMGRGMGGGPMGQGGMMGMGMMADSCPMGGMMMHGMMGRTMVPTEDGGVVVMVGNLLYKYDRNLALKKEAEIRIDTAKLRESMMGMSRACRMLMGSIADTSTAKPGNPANPTGGNSPGGVPVSPVKTAGQEKSGAPASKR